MPLLLERIKGVTDNLKKKLKRKEHKKRRSRFYFLETDDANSLPEQHGLSWKPMGIYMLQARI